MKWRIDYSRNADKFVLKHNVRIEVREEIKKFLIKMKGDNINIDLSKLSGLTRDRRVIMQYDDSVKKAKKRLERGWVALMSTVKNKKDKVLFDDLKDECVKFIKLMNQLRVQPEITW